MDLVDFFPRPKQANVLVKGAKQSPYRETTKVAEELKKWLVRRVECIRGHMTLGEFPLEFPLFPSFPSFLLGLNGRVGCVSEFVL